MPRTVTTSLLVAGFVLPASLARAQVYVPAPPQPMAMPQPEGSAPNVQVRLKATVPGVTLYQLVSSGPYLGTHVTRSGAVGTHVEVYKDWRPTCQAPCGVDLNSGATYRIAGPGIRRSPPFMMAGLPSPVTLDVKAGSSRRYAGGVALVVLGSVATVGGLVPIALSPRGDIGAKFSPFLLAIGLVVTLPGLAGIGGGAYLLATTRTEVRLDGGQRIARLEPRLTLSADGLHF